MSEADFASYADHNTASITCDSIDDVIISLETDSIKLLKWFADKQMRVNKDQCHLLISTNESSTINVHINIPANKKMLSQCSHNVRQLVVIHLKYYTHHGLLKIVKIC